jgi:two-component system phosphate regulon sensor histidine kinase PhoR
LLQVAINNLIDNSVKYGDVNGVIRVDFKVLNRKVLRISVANKADKLTKHQLTEIFEKYSRIGGNKEIAGAGLGLYLVKHIINLHHGSIRAISLPNRWLCFVIKLPIKTNGELNNEY